ncbi:hypothetical protein [Aquibacillus albus]|uniref:Sporulation protein YjcZ n=1 Tax=Aquibacillus albus TaxID=1168171 RepID=A0ABS2MUM5_9BACI|nr:hypothetical protein [Aquibacillus albus]MBM7569582.1 hypothetical protein [Aquibacillus albus]
MPYWSYQPANYPLTSYGDDYNQYMGYDNTIDYGWNNAYGYGPAYGPYYGSGYGSGLGFGLFIVGIVLLLILGGGYYYLNYM